MKTFIALLDFTDQGIRRIEDSPHRADQFNDLAERAGARVDTGSWLETTGIVKEGKGLVWIDAQQLALAKPDLEFKTVETPPAPFMGPPPGTTRSPGSTSTRASPQHTIMAAQGSRPTATMVRTGGR